MLTLSCGKEAKDKTPEVYSGTDQYVAQDKLNEAMVQLYEAAKTNDLKSFKSVYESNPTLDLNSLVGGQKDTILIITLKNRSRDVFDFIINRRSDKGLEKSVDLERMSEENETFARSPLSIATIYGRYNMAQTLISKGALINSIDKNGYTALHYALREKNDRMAILLLQSNADINILDPEGRNAYRMALELDCVGTVDYIHGLTQINQGAIPDSTTLKKLIEVGDVRMVSRVLSRHPDLVARYEVINPLARALEIFDDNRSFQMVSILVNAGFNANGLEKDSESPLIRAVKKNRILVAELLLQKGADIEQRDANGFSPLYHAINNNLPEMVDLLVSREAKKFYKHKSENGKYYFWVCNEARKVRKEISDSKSLQDNETILHRLNCL